MVDLLERRERDFTRLQRQRMSAADFEPLTLIGRGAFGEVLSVLSAGWCSSRLTEPSTAEAVLTALSWEDRESDCRYGCRRLLAPS